MYSLLSNNKPHGGTASACNPGQRPPAAPTDAVVKSQEV